MYFSASFTAWQFSESPTPLIWTPPPPWPLMLSEGVEWRMTREPSSHLPRQIQTWPFMEKMSPVWK